MGVGKLPNPTKKGMLPTRGYVNSFGLFQKVATSFPFSLLCKTTRLDLAHIYYKENLRP